MTSSIIATRASAAQIAPHAEQKISDAANAKPFSRSAAPEAVKARPQPDGMFSGFFRRPAAYGQVFNQEVAEANQQHAQALFNHVWNSDHLKNEIIMPLPLNAHINVGGKNQQVHMQKIGNGLEFYSVQKGPHGFNTRALARYENNQPPQYFNGLKSDDPVIAMMMMSALSKLQQSSPRVG